MTAAALKPVERKPWGFNSLFRRQLSMTKPEARKILRDFATAQKYAGMDRASCLDFFDHCFGIEEAHEREAYSLVGEEYLHVIAVVYDDW